MRKLKNTWLNLVKRFYHIVWFLFSLLPFAASSQNVPDTSLLPNDVPKNTIDTIFNVKDFTFTTNVFLPPGYKLSKKRYPVIYLINISKTTLITEEVSDSLCSFINKKYPAAIILEINAVKKDSVLLDDYALQNSLLPLKEYVDAHFLTDASPESSIIAGYGPGAGIALKIALENQQIFERSGILLLDFTAFNNLEDWVSSHAGNMSGMMFIHSFEEKDSENEKMLHFMMEEIAKHSKGLLYHFLDASKINAVNNQPSFLEFYKWIVSNGHNYIIKPGKIKTVSRKVKP